jgi:ketose-bisphosphate aldolase
MSYVNTREMLSEAKKGKYAVGAFNIVDPMTAAAAVRAAEAKKAPVIIQTSTKTVQLYGYSALAATVRSLAERSSVPVALHLDHCKDIEIIRSCIKAGWTSVMIDASTFPFEQNIKLTEEVVKMARAYDVTVEGELGSIVGVEDDIHIKEQEAHLADPEQAREYVSRTGVDIFAPAIGTAHGVYKGEPKIAFDLLEKIASEVKAAIAIHGGTGLSDGVFKKCIDLGGVKINVSTQIKIVFRDSLLAYFRDNPLDYEPVRILAKMRDEVQSVIESFMDKFGSGNKVQTGERLDGRA